LRTITRNKGSNAFPEEQVKMSIRSGINWTKTIVASAILCTVFSVSVMAQKNPNKLLNKNEVRILVSRLKERLQKAAEIAVGIEEHEIAKIFELWDARRNLVGKTQAQVIDLLYSDYVPFSKDLDPDPWDALQVANVDDESLQEETKSETPVEPAVEPEKPGKTEPSEEPVAPDTIRYYFANLRTDAETEALEPDVIKAARSNRYLVVIVGLVFHKDKEGKLTGTGSFDISFQPQGNGPEGFIQTIESKQIAGSKIVITGTKKP